MDHQRTHSPRQRPTLWAGLFLGLLLGIFVAVFLYVALLFVNWGKSTAAAVPEMPALPLPKLVRAAPEGPEESQSQANSGIIFQAPATPQPAAKAVQAPTERRVTIVIMGVDNRPDERVENSRTDSIIVLTVNPSTGAAGMLSMARDTLVYVPALKHDAKVNTLHVLGYLNKYPGGGPAMLKDTLAEFIGYPIDYYVRLNFDGFRQIVDLIGGIDVDVPKDIHDPDYPDNNYGYEGFDITAGHHHLDGATALKYARTRNLDSDYERARRQQQVIMAVRDKLRQPGQLAGLIPRIPSLAIALANSVQTDMPVDRAIALARALDKADLKNPERMVVDNTMGTQNPNDPNFGFVLRPDLNKVRMAAARIFADSMQGPSAEEMQRQALQAESARIVVLNGSAQEGLAAKTAATLSAEGYNVVAIGNAEGGDRTQSYLVTYGDTKPQTREALLRRFNLGENSVRSEPPSADADLAIVLGNDISAPGSTAARASNP